MTVDDLKERIDLASFIRAQGIELRKHGRDLIGLCPFHADGEPSLIVTPGKELWHCMGCGKGGSVIDFVMEQQGCTSGEAIKQLKEEEAGALPPNPRQDRSPALDPANNGDCVTVSNERALQLLERVITLYEKQSTEAQSYLESRGITDAGLVTTNRIGFCNGSLPDLLPQDGKIHDELTSIGILGRKPAEASGEVRERFKGCVVFPVFDESGSVVTLYGRYTGNQPSPKGYGPTSGKKRHVYLPDRPTGLWNLAAARSFHEVILVESIIDALSVMMAGYQNVISIQGTNGLSDEDIAKLQQLGVKKIRLLLDGDASGEKTKDQLKEKLFDTFTVSAYSLPSGHDPNSFLLAEGAEGLASFLSYAEGTSRELSVGSGVCDHTPAELETESRNTHASHDGALPQTPPGRGRPPRTPRNNDSVTASHSNSASHVTVACGLRNYLLFGIEKSARKLKVTIRLEHAGKLHIDTLDLYSARARQQLTRDLCRVFEQDPDTIEADLNRVLVSAEAAQAESEAAQAGEAEELKVEITEADHEAALTLARDPHLVERILDDFETCGLVGEETNKLLCYLAMTSRKMADPLSVLILSSSGAGKTALQDGALAFCPPEDLVKLTSLSGKALFYKERNSLKHKVLALEEGAGAEDASYAIRNLISADSLTTESTMRDPVSGKLTTMENTVEGPTAVFVTTTNPQVDAETRSRFLVTGIDESREQTRRILAFQRGRHGHDGLQENLHKPDILHLHRNFQRILRKLQVVNPYARQMSYGDDRLQSRRLQPQYLSLVGAVAFLRQYQKEVKTYNGCEYIEVELQDIELGNRLAVEILGRTLDELSIPARSLLDQLHVMVTERAGRLQEASPERPVRGSEIPFTRKEIREYTGWAQTRTRTHLKELVELEYVVLNSSPSGRLQQYYLLYDGEGRDGEPFIPGLEIE